jgi:hypothetical protein
VTDSTIIGQRVAEITFPVDRSKLAELARACGDLDPRFKIYDAGYQASAALRDAMGEKDFESAWAEGAALSTEEAVAYAQRGRGQRERPTSGWASLTPTERDVVRLVAKGWPTTTSPQGFSSHRAPCKPTSPTSTPNSASTRGCNSSKKPHATPELRRENGTKAKPPIPLRAAQQTLVGRQTLTLT